MTTSSLSQNQFATVVQIKRRDAEVEATKPEAAGPAATDTPDMAPAEAAGEAAMFPRVIEVEAGIIASGVVSNPLAVVVDVRGFGMSLAVFERRMGFGWARRAVSGLWTMVGNVSAADVMAAAVLPEGGKGEDQGYTKDSAEKPHGQPPTPTLPPALWE